MKKAALIFSLILIVGLSACGTKKPEDTDAAVSLADGVENTVADSGNLADENITDGNSNDSATGAVGFVSWADAGLEDLSLIHI